MLEIKVWFARLIGHDGHEAELIGGGGDVIKGIPVHLTFDTIINLVLVVDEEALLSLTNLKSRAAESELDRLILLLILRLRRLIQHWLLIFTAIGEK